MRLFKHTLVRCRKWSNDLKDEGQGTVLVKVDSGATKITNTSRSPLFRLLDGTSGTLDPSHVDIFVSQRKIIKVVCS